MRKAPRRVDYLLRYERNFPLAVVEAKASYKSAGDGLQQAKEYASMLGLNFAYATNGKEIIEFDGVVNLGREMYFAIYQAIAKDERRPGLYKEFLGGFFDLVMWTNATAAAPATIRTGGKF